MPFATDEILALLSNVRGGRFRAYWQTDEYWIDQFFAIGVYAWQRDVFHKHHWLAGLNTGRHARNLREFGDLAGFIPFAGNQVQIFVYSCHDRSIFVVDTEECGTVERIYDSLEQFQRSLRPKALGADMVTEFELVNRMLMSDDEALFSAEVEELRAIRTGPERASILHLATIHDCLAIMKNLIDRGFDPLEKDGEGNNTLHLAAYCESTDCMRHLIQCESAHLETKNSRGQTPLMVACERPLPAPRTAILLLNAGASSQFQIEGLSLQDWLQKRNSAHLDSHTIPINEYLKSGKADDLV
jgi:hypothetical protein